jgi:hypothetical protein
VEAKINRRINPGADDTEGVPADHGCMTTTEYLLNALFVLAVLRQARDRQLDLRSFLVPFVILFFVARQYIHSVPTAGNDLVLVGALAAVGVAFGLTSALTTRVRLGDDGAAYARVGWIAGILLTIGIGSRMVFAFVVTHGAEPAIRSFSISHQIGAAAWPVALVSMAILEVVTRVSLVHLRGRRLTQAPSIAAGAAA